MSSVVDEMNNLVIDGKGDKQTSEQKPLEPLQVTIKFWFSSIYWLTAVNN